jgi:hypothetical protein
MGLFSSGSSKSYSGSAQKWAKPFAKAGASSVMDVFNSNAGNLSALSGAVSGLVPGLVDKFEGGNAGVDAAGGYVTDVLGGKYLNGNPHLQGMIDATMGDVTSRVNANFGSRGSFGGTAHTTALGKALSEAELGLRYGNYSDEMGRMGSAAGMAPGIAQGEYAGLSEILGAAGLGAELPYTGINAMSGALGNLFSGGKSTQKGPGIGSQMLAAGAQAAGAYAAAGSDRRLKKNIVMVGELPNGLNVYDFTYKSDPEESTYRGVMADEVQVRVPEAFIENFNGSGMAGVNYALVGMPLLKLAA